MSSLRTLVTCCFVLLACLGCSGQFGQSGHFATPEECFAVYAQHVKSGDPGGVLECYTDEMKNMVVGTMVFQLQGERFLKRDNAGACDELLKKYNHDKTDVMGILQQNESAGAKGAAAGFVQVGATISNKQQFMKDVRAVLKDSFPATDVNAPAPTLTDVKIDGETATGMMWREGSGQPIEFRRINGSWLMAANLQGAN